MSTKRFWPDSGFVAHNDRPDKDRPEDWVVWHFTHIANLPAIAASGVLLPDSGVSATVNVAFDSVKALRRDKAVQPDPGYPRSFVSDHVPFYIAARSPMLYVVCRYGAHEGGAGPLVFLGARLGDIAATPGLIWCASDGNAAAGFTRFSRDLSSVGSFVDFDLLCQRDWDNTPDDPNRKSRRAAEILVHGRLPLELVTDVACYNDATCAQAAAILSGVGGVRQYTTKPELYY
ncbi:MAG: DUF4433 domain-containing protein [Mycobacterium sp.]